MSHVDEGALNAYLDGALEEYPTGEARRIRAHLERCEQCARALAEVRRVRDQADMLLAIPDVDVPMPSLEELRRLAQSAPEGGDASPRRVPLYRLWWAASVVLALGVGWMLRGGLPETSTPTMADAASDATASATEQEAPSRQLAPSARTPTAVSDEASAPAGAAEPAQADPMPAEAPRVAEAVPVAPTPSDLPEVDVTAVAMAAADETDSATELLEDMAVTVEAPPVAAEQMVAAPPGADVPPTDLVAARVADATLADTPRARERSEPVAASPRVAVETRSAPVVSGLQVGGVAAGGSEEEPVRTDDVSEPGSLVVPGLEVVTIQWREEGVVPAGVRVLQRLDDDELLELIHLPAGFDPSAVEPAEPGVAELVVPRDQGWIIMRAPLPQEELRALLERMDAPPPE